MTFADTHCHLDMKQFDPDRKEVIDRFFAAGGELLVNASFDQESANQARRIAETRDYIYFIAGIHPHYAHPLTGEEKETLRGHRLTRR